MQNRFYGDRKDVLKWSVALGAAVPASEIVYVAMMRPDGDVGGADFGKPGPARQEVVGFFDRERAAFGADGRMRTVGRIAGLDARIRLVPAIYRFDGGMSYFRNIAAEFLPTGKDRRSVVLVDPDRGVRQNGSVNKQHERVCPNELALLWRAMEPGDCLIVYQTPHRLKAAGLARYDRPRSLVSEGIGVPGDRIDVQDYGDIGFLIAHKCD